MAVDERGYHVISDNGTMADFEDDPAVLNSMISMRTYTDEVEFKEALSYYNARNTGTSYGNDNSPANILEAAYEQLAEENKEQ